MDVWEQNWPKTDAHVAARCRSSWDDFKKERVTSVERLWWLDDPKWCNITRDLRENVIFGEIILDISLKWIQMDD